MSEKKPIKVGLIGCGTIANRAYMPSIINQFSMVDVVKFADTVPERAEMFAKKFGGVACTNEDIYNDPEIEVVLNLTYPSSHYEVTKNAILAGKHVHCEKMMAVTWEEGKELADLAEEKGVWFTMAPDTFLGGVWQTCRHIIDLGVIGEPVSVFCALGRGGMGMGGRFGKSTRREYPRLDNGGGGFPMMGERLPGFNPRPPQGSGAPFDMGGYYLHNMINMFGNIHRVSGVCRPAQEKQTVMDPLNTMYKEYQETPEPTMMIGTLEFDSGVAGVFLMPPGKMDTQFQVIGTNGTLFCPDPNFFGGEIVIQHNSGKPMVFDPKWGPLPDGKFTVPTICGYNNESRGIGLMDLAFAIRNGRKPRCHYSMGLQAFECVHGMIESYKTGIEHVMISHTERPKAAKPGFSAGFGENESFAQQSYFDD
ncbi:MAG: Gfo/Idh/MocA family oxidoreductase [Lachnospiraceae bacterium]|nr:Gfo/Idh/MocA family oxidoreductase [Lachnospiraceae bacterium]